MATKIKKGEIFGVGALIQLIGVVVCFLIFPIGLIVGILLLIVGGRMAYVWKCSECRGKVDKHASVCQHCRAEFGVGGGKGAMPDWAASLKD
jgi:hypothetical protein